MSGEWSNKLHPHICTAYNGWEYENVVWKYALFHINYLDRYTLRIQNKCSPPTHSHNVDSVAIGIIKLKIFPIKSRVKQELVADALGIHSGKKLI